MSNQNNEPHYVIIPNCDPPERYPKAPIVDTYRVKSEGKTFDHRRQEYIQHVLRNPSPRNTKPVFYELVRMVGGEQAHEGILSAALAYINSRRDCSDFVLHGFLRLMYQFADTKLSANDSFKRFSVKYPPSTSLLSRSEETLLDFKYFPNEPGVDSMCSWTENHYILFTSAAYLAGQLFPERIFTNSGEIGQEKMALNRPRILKWMDLRFRTGFSEWLSNVYYD